MGNMRISGLASGMDTDAMVQSLMKVERLKVSRFEQTKQIALWRQEAYTSINKMFANFVLNTRKDMGLTKTTSTGMAVSNAYSNLDYIRKATSSDATKATVSATSKAVNGSFSLKIDKLATGATIVDEGINEGTLAGIGEIKVKLEIAGENGAISTKTIDISSATDMNDLVKQINSHKDADGKPIGVTAFYDKENKKLFLQTSETGKKVELTLSYSGNDIQAKGENAEVYYNGTTKLEYSSNRFNFNGLDIELKDVGTINVKVDTNTEGIMEKIEKLINDYNELVDKASALLGEKRYSSYHPLSQEERAAMKEADLKLWDEKAKSGMLSNDETISRTLQTMRNELYKSLEGVDGFKSIIDIGITTESYARGAVGGKLQIDKEKLRAAIDKDPEGIMNLFFKEGNFDANGKEIDKDGNPIAAGKSTKGVFTRIYDSLIDGMKSIIDKSGPGEDKDLLRSVKSNILIDFVTKKSSISDIDKEVTNANKRIDDLNALLYRKENAYYAKFAHMEKMLAQMQSQGSWIGQQLMR